MPCPYGQGDEGAAAIALLSEVLGQALCLPWEGQVVSLDAGLMERPVVEAVVKKGALRRDSEGQPAGSQASS